MERDQRTVRLTSQGARFARHCQETLDSWQGLKQGLRGGTEGLSGTISLFASVTACQSFLPRLLSAFRSRHPDIHLRLDTGHAADALDMLRRGSVDVAVAALPERTPPTLVTREVLRTPLVFVAPTSPCDVARQCEQTTLPWAEIPIVLPETGLARAAADGWFRKKRISPRVYGEVLGNEAILSLVALGCGVGVVPRIVVDKSPLRAELRPIDVDPRLPELRVGLSTLKRKLSSPLVRAFWDTVDTTAG